MCCREGRGPKAHPHRAKRSESLLRFGVCCAKLVAVFRCGGFSAAKKKGAYMSKAYFANVLDRIRDGVERFWIFHFCAVFFALLVVQRNHGIVDASTARQMSHGICWGALAGLFVQLAGEWRRWRLRKTYAFIVTLIAGAAGWWFWHAVGKDSPCNEVPSSIYCQCV